METSKIDQEAVERMKIRTNERMYEAQERHTVVINNMSFNIESYTINGLPHAVSRIKPGRKQGNTARQISDTIELMFEHKTVGFMDHAYIAHEQEAFRLKLYDRLKREYPQHQIVRDWVPEDTADREPRPGTIVIGRAYLKLIE